MTPQMIRYSDRPELWDSIGGLSSEVWPEYNRHGDVLNQYWDRLYETFPEWQFVLYDAGPGQVLAEGHTIPVAWDGTDAALGPGIDASIQAGFALRAAGRTPTALCALAAEILPRHQGRGLASMPDPADGPGQATGPRSTSWPTCTPPSARAGQPLASVSAVSRSAAEISEYPPGRVPAPQWPISAVWDAGWPRSTTWSPSPSKNAVQLAAASGRPSW